MSTSQIYLVCVHSKAEERRQTGRTYRLPRSAARTQVDRWSQSIPQWVDFSGCCHSVRLHLRRGLSFEELQPTVCRRSVKITLCPPLPHNSCLAWISLDSYRLCRHRVPWIYNSFYNVLGEVWSFTCTDVSLAFLSAAWDFLQESWLTQERGRLQQSSRKLWLSSSQLPTLASWPGSRRQEESYLLRVESLS